MSENLQMTQELDVSPKKATGKTGSFRITVTNSSEQTTEYQLSAGDPDNKCSYRFDRDTVTVEAGASVTVTLTVSFRNALPAVTSQICDFTVSATKTTGEVATAQGQLERPAFLPVWVLVGGGVAIAAIIAIIVAVSGGGDGTTTPTLTLTMAVSGNGSITPAAGAHQYSEGEVVDITATPASGWQFDGWTGDVANSGSTSTTVTMDSGKTVTANFSEIPPEAVTVTLIMAVNGSGSTTPAVGTHQYVEGEVVNITATAAGGWQFDGWTGDVANSGSASTTIIMDDSKTVTASFSEIPPEAVTLTMAVNGSGSTTPAVGDHEYTEDEVVNITATADDGWLFTGWTGDVADPDSASTTVTMDASKTVTANFAEAPPEVPDISGVWRLEVFNIDSSCGPEPGWSSDVTVVQDGTALETTGIKGSTFIVTGSIDGDTVTIGPGAFPDAGGTTTATYFLTIVNDTLMEGREEWTWTDGVTTCTGGTATIRFTRIG